MRAKMFAAEKKGQKVDADDFGVDDGEALRRGFGEFQHEVRLISSLSHANIVRLFGIMLNPLRMVMELCQHGDLLSALAESKVWPQLPPNGNAPVPPLCARIVRDVASGMAYLHAQHPPIAHRDLRSPNVFLVSLDANAPCCAKVADFGLSVVVTVFQKEALSSWQWMAPEAQMGDKYTERCDVYSFAMVANEVYTAQIPFLEYEHTVRQADMFKRIVHDALRPTIPRYVPQSVRQVIEAMWLTDPLRRLPMAECVRVLAGETGVLQQDAPLVAYTPSVSSLPTMRVVVELPCSACKAAA